MMLTDQEIEEMKDELFARWQAHVAAELEKWKKFSGPAADVRRERIFHYQPQAKDDPK